MAFIVPVLRSDYALYSTTTTTTTTATTTNGGIVDGGVGRPRKSSILTHKRRLKTKMNVIGNPASCPVIEEGRDHAAATAGGNNIDNNSSSNETFALANTPSVVSLASGASNSPKECHSRKQLDMVIKLPSAPHNASFPAGSTDTPVDSSGEASPLLSGSPRASAGVRNRRVSFPPMEGSTRPESPGEKRVHFGFYEEIPYQEVEEEAIAEENGVPDGLDAETKAEVDEAVGEEVAEREVVEEKEDVSKEPEDQSVFTWSCPNREIRKTARERAFSTPSTSGSPESPAMITNEAVAAMLKTKRETESQLAKQSMPVSDASQSLPSSPISPKMRSRCLSDTTEDTGKAGDKSVRLHTARKYSKGLLRFVGLCSPPKSGNH